MYKMITRDHEGTLRHIQTSSYDDLRNHFRDRLFVRILDGFTTIYERVGKQVVINKVGFILPLH